MVDDHTNISSGDGCDDSESNSDSEDHDIKDYDDGVGDTVGVVVLDRAGNVAGTVSSGGIALKQPGRVGQASCFGCGCWAQKPIKIGSNSTAVSTTGTIFQLITVDCAEGLLLKQ